MAHVGGELLRSPAQRGRQLQTPCIVRFLGRRLRLGGLCFPEHVLQCQYGTERRSRRRGAERYHDVAGRERTSDLGA